MVHLIAVPGQEQPGDRWINVGSADAAWSNKNEAIGEVETFCRDRVQDHRLRPQVAALVQALGLGVPPPSKRYAVAEIDRAMAGRSTGQRFEAKSLLHVTGLLG